MWGRKRKELEASVARLQERVRELESEHCTLYKVLAKQNEMLQNSRAEIRQKENYIKHLEQVIRELK